MNDMAMQRLYSRSQDRLFYKVTRKPNSFESIPADIVTTEDRKTWAFRHGYTAIGWHLGSWIAYN